MALIGKALLYRSVIFSFSRTYFCILSCTRSSHTCLYVATWCPHKERGLVKLAAQKLGLCGKAHLHPHLSSNLQRHPHISTMIDHCFFSTMAHTRSLPLIISTLRNHQWRQMCGHATYLLVGPPWPRNKRQQLAAGRCRRRRRLFAPCQPFWAPASPFSTSLVRASWTVSHESGNKQILLASMQAD